MSIDIGQSLQEGLTRAVSPNGLGLIVVWAVLGVFSQLANNSLMAALYAGLPVDPTVIGPSLDVSPMAAGLGMLVVYLVSFVVMAGALRTFVTDERRSIPMAHFTHNLGWMLLNLVVGFIVFYLGVTIGFVLLVVPGIFLLVSLFFWYVLVIVEDQNFYEAFQNSWTLTKGNRWSLLGIGVIVIFGGSILMGIPLALSFALSEWAGLVLMVVTTSVFGVVSLAITARVYVQVAEQGSAAGV